MCDIERVRCCSTGDPHRPSCVRDYHVLRYPFRRCQVPSLCTFGTLAMCISRILAVCVWNSRESIDALALCPLVPSPRLLGPAHTKSLGTSTPCLVVPFGTRSLCLLVPSTISP
eukprot:1976918-Rhodomonas_salina.1